MNLYMTELLVSDWPTSVAWYCDRLGLRLRLRDDEHCFALFEASGGGRLALKAGTVTNANPTTLHFQVSDLEAELTRLAVVGLAPTAEIHTSSEGYREAFLHDPDGHRIGLFEFLTTPTAI